jgi:hypothetical protein
MSELINVPKMAGLPNTKSNPIFSKDIFNMFVPKFKNWIDRLDGDIEKIINTSTDVSITDTITKINLENSYIKDARNKLVLDLNNDNDFIIGKRSISCYRSGYNNVTTLQITDTSGLENEIIISYKLNYIEFKSYTLKLDANETKNAEIEFNFGNNELNSILTIEIKDSNNSSTLDSLNITIKSNFKAANGDGALLFETFCTIADQKIIKNIWNTDWEYGMSLCIAHYLAITVRETEVSYGLGDIAQDTNPRGLKTSDRQGGSLQDGNYKHSGLQEKYDFKNIMLTHQETKFWNSTEFGRLLITLL